MTDTIAKLAVPTFTKALRKKKKWTQEKLAQEAGLSTAAVHNLEAEKNGFTDKTLKALADALSCEPWQLLVEPGHDAKVSSEGAVKELLRKIEGLPEEAINPVWRLISGYVEDAE
ncbi:helix-turn-helix transcriptional regulator [Agrobacterium rhizogenes]|nr:helix-turn-helix transcriptional regulator [Rhizobium rhizogenes]